MCFFHFQSHRPSTPKSCDHFHTLLSFKICGYPLVFTRSTLSVFAYLRIHLIFRWKSLFTVLLRSRLFFLVFLKMKCFVYEPVYFSLQFFRCLHPAKKPQRKLLRIYRYVSLHQIIFFFFIFQH